MLAREYSHLKIIVQDAESVIKDGHAVRCARFSAQYNGAHLILQFWRREYPESLVDGRVKLQTHDFFKPQPVKNAAAFFLRYILHDWPAEKAKLILKALRHSATPNTKLILMENIVPYAVSGPEQNIPGDKVPFPLLPNLGVVNLGCYISDIHVRSGLSFAFDSVSQI